jgi:hypothetical protein
LYPVSGRFRGELGEVKGDPDVSRKWALARTGRKPSRLEDRGAVAVEFALLLPVQVLMFAGIFGLGAAMIQETQLNYVVDAAAFREATTAGGVTSASAQLPPPAAFGLSQTPKCSALIVGQWPINLGMLPPLTLSAQAC